MRQRAAFLLFLFVILVTRPCWAGIQLTLQTPSKDSSTIPYDNIRILGHVSSETELKHVLIRLFDYSRNVFTIYDKKAGYNPEDQTWFYDIHAEDLSPGRRCLLYIEGMDAQNTRRRLYRYLNVEDEVSSQDDDLIAPRLRVTRLPFVVTSDSFVIHGTASDNIAIKKVVIYMTPTATRRRYRVRGSRRGRISEQIAEYHPEDGSWSYAVDPSLYVANSFVLFTVQAYDTSGNSTRRTRWVFVRSTGDHDTSPPTVQIHSPDHSGPVSREGFVVAASAEDSDGVASVRVSYYDRFRGGFTIQDAEAAIDPESGHWQYVISPEYFSPGQSGYVIVTAEDTHGNKGNWTRSFHIEPDPSRDVERPELSIDTPQKLENVSRGGFTIQGRATDAWSGIRDVRVSLYNSARRGYVFEKAMAAYDELTQTFHYAIRREDLDLGAYVSVTVYATDTIGNNRSSTYSGVVINHSPLWQEIAPIRIETQTSLHMDLKDKVHDEDGDDLVLEKISGPDWITINNGVIQGETSASRGTHDLVVAASDGKEHIETTILIDLRSNFSTFRNEGRNEIQSESYELHFGALTGGGGQSHSPQYQIHLGTIPFYETLRVLYSTGHELILTSGSTESLFESVDNPPFITRLQTNAQKFYAGVPFRIYIHAEDEAPDSLRYEISIQGQVSQASSVPWADILIPENGLQTLTIKAIDHNARESHVTIPIYLYRKPKSTNSTS